MFDQNYKLFEEHEFSLICFMCSQGEAVHSYRDAQILRTKLVKLYEAIDQLRSV